MNEGSESSGELTPEQALLIEACKSYLDVIHAINAFQTRICHMACDVIDAARDRISKIAALAKPLKTPVNTYIYPPVADNNFDGSEAWVGAKIRLDGPLWADLYLALVFHYDPNGNQQTPHVCFALEVWQKNVLNQLDNIF